MLVVRVTSSSAGAIGFQLRTHDGTVEQYPVTNGDMMFASTQTGLIAHSTWKDFPAGTDPSEVHLFGWVDAGSVTFNSAYLLIRPNRP